MYYKLTFEFWDFEWENSETFFFKTKKEAKAKQKEIGNENVYKNRRFFIEKVSFEEMKEEITVEAFEKLFNIAIEDVPDILFNMIQELCEDGMPTKDTIKEWLINKFMKER